MVGRESSKQPPWSIAMSTSTEPGFICATSRCDTSFGALAPGTSTAPMTRSAPVTALLQVEGVGGDGLDAAVELGVDLAQLGDVQVEHGDLGAHAQRDRGGVLPGHAAADDDDVRPGDAGHAAHQHAATAVVAHQVVRADLRGEPAGDLAHRGEQGQRPVGSCTVS